MSNNDDEPSALRGREWLYRVKMDGTIVENPHLSEERRKVLKAKFQQAYNQFVEEGLSKWHERLAQEEQHSEPDEAQ